MIDLGNRQIDDYGQTTYSESGVTSVMKANPDTSKISEILVPNEDWVHRYFEECKKLFITPLPLKIIESREETLDEFDQVRQSVWSIPSKYKEMDVLVYVLKKCKTEYEADRVLKEWELYSERNLVDLLRTMIFLVDHFIKNGIVWGVGRGSSVSSYILYLIGVHKVNSLKYGLEIEEFLR